MLTYSVCSATFEACVAKTLSCLDADQNLWRLGPPLAPLSTSLSYLDGRARATLRLRLVVAYNRQPSCSYVRGTTGW